MNIITVTYILQYNYNHFSYCNIAIHVLGYLIQVKQPTSFIQQTVFPYYIKS